MINLIFECFFPLLGVIFWGWNSIFLFTFYLFDLVFDNYYDFQTLKMYSKPYKQTPQINDFILEKQFKNHRLIFIGIFIVIFLFSFIYAFQIEDKKIVLLKAFSIENYDLILCLPLVWLANYMKYFVFVKQKLYLFNSKNEYPINWNLATWALYGFNILLIGFFLFGPINNIYFEAFLALIYGVLKFLSESLFTKKMSN